MTLNTNRTICHFSNRLDVGLHFVKTGGFNGYIEYFDRMSLFLVKYLVPLTKNKKRINMYDLKELMKLIIFY